MNWKDTVIKSNDIKWVRPRVKSTDDGKLDFDIHLPFTGLFEGQAKQSFAQGVLETFKFFGEHKSISVDDIYAFLKECGLSGIAEQLIENNR